MVKHVMDRVIGTDKNANGEESNGEFVLPDIFKLLRTPLKVGDEVILPIPAFGVYEPIIRLSGGVMVPVLMQLKSMFLLPWYLPQARWPAPQYK